MSILKRMDWKSFWGGFAAIGCGLVLSDAGGLMERYRMTDPGSPEGHSAQIRECRETIRQLEEEKFRAEMESLHRELVPGLREPIPGREEASAGAAGPSSGCG